VHCLSPSMFSPLNGQQGPSSKTRASGFRKAIHEKPGDTKLSTAINSFMPVCGSTCITCRRTGWCNVETPRFYSRGVLMSVGTSTILAKGFSWSSSVRPGKRRSITSIRQFSSKSFPIPPITLSFDVIQRG
jgi:hypothetical protein